MPKTSSRTIRSKPAAKKVAELSASTAIEAATLKSFSRGDADHQGFAFTRYWWEAEGPREGISGWVRKKLNPGDDPEFGNAAKAEVLLPNTAPSDYLDLAFLLERFDRRLPVFERHVMIQLKVSLGDDDPWHAGYERVRGFAHAHFCRRGFPVILVAHIPCVAGLEGNGSHVHCIVLSRRITINGLQGACHRLCSDKGYAEALASWRSWVAAGENAA